MNVMGGIGSKGQISLAGSNCGPFEKKENYSTIIKVLKIDTAKKGEGDEFQEEDECNLINKEDFDEGKTLNIITARATPIKCNALAKKNLSTVRK